MSNDPIRDALIGFLWRSIADGVECCCDPGDPGLECRAWRALGHRGHFKWQRAGRRLARGHGEGRRAP